MFKMFLLNWFFVMILMFIFWILYLWKKNPAIIDMAWSLAIMLSAIQYFLIYKFNSVKLIFLIFLLIWGLRLAGYLLLTRVLPGYVDKRYLNISKAWKIKKSLGFLLNYQLQGILAIFIALPFYWISQLSQFFLPSFFAIALIFIGMIGETFADIQLQNFKKTSPSKVCNVGFWSYSRHPNYFFEWLIWLGFATAALELNSGLFAYFSPLLLLFIMLKVTGPITEKIQFSIEAKLISTIRKKLPCLFFFPQKRKLDVRFFFKK